VAGKVIALSPATGAATSATKGPSVQWDTDPAHTDKLVAWILNHPTDCNILFHDHLSNTPPPTLSPEDKPSRKNKKDVTTVIAKYIFQDDQVYSTLYASDMEKFATSVTNRCESKCGFGSEQQPKHNTNKGLRKCASGGLPPRCPERMC